MGDMLSQSRALSLGRCLQDKDSSTGHLLLLIATMVKLSPWPLACRHGGTHVLIWWRPLMNLRWLQNGSEPTLCNSKPKCMHVHMSACLCVYVPVCLCACVPVRLCMCVSVCLCVCTSVHLCISAPVHIYIYILYV